MSRTKGSGWGGGTIFYQLCPLCNKKKVYYKYITKLGYHFYCTSCKEILKSNTDSLIKQTHI